MSAAESPPQHPQQHRDMVEVSVLSYRSLADAAVPVTDDEGDATSMAARPLTVELQFGTRTFKTPPSSSSTADQQESNWPQNATFSLRLSFHACLFGTMHMAVYEQRPWYQLGRRLLGRVSVRVSTVVETPHTFTSPYEVIDEITGQAVGVLTVRLRHYFAERGFMFGDPQAMDAGLRLPPVAGDDDERSGTPSLDADMMLLAPPSTPAPPSNTSLMEQELYVDRPGIADPETKTHLEESIEWFLLEDADAPLADTDETTATPTLFDRLTQMLLSEEHVSTLKTIHHLLQTWNQTESPLTQAQIYSGLTMLERYFLTAETPREDQRVLDLSVIERSRHLYRMALASYGWKGLAFVGRGTVVDGTKAHADLRAASQFLGIPRDKFLNFELARESLFKPSYFVVHDEFLQSVVLVVRGTMSASDTLTDLVCEYRRWSDGFVHGGMLMTARWLVKHVLPVVLAHARRLGVERVLFVGHSLGAGTATLVTMMAMTASERGQLDLSGLDVQCHGFASPPSVSLNLSQRYQDRITSYVVEDDIVTRLSYGHLADLKSLLVVASRLDAEWSAWPWTPKSEQRAHELRVREALDACRRRLKNPPDAKMKHVKLSLPGKVYHLVYADRRRRPFGSVLRKSKELGATTPPFRSPVTSGASTPIGGATKVSLGRSPALSLSGTPSLPPTPYKKVHMYLSSAENFDEILVRRTMFLEHLPNVYDKAFQRAFESCMLDNGQQQQKEEENV